MKKILALLAFIILLVNGNAAFASKIPDAELNVLQQNFHNVNVRFDGLVELSDGTTYIPVYPLKTEEVQSDIKVITTIPAKQKLTNKPDFFMFNTNFAFFKIKKDKDKSTVIYNDSIPTEVKMGLLPQDLLVPVGFQIPAQLKIIIGDLLIPVIPSKDFKEVTIATNAEVEQAPKTKIVEQAAKQLSNKYFYTSNFKKNTISILNTDNGKAFKQIEFSSIPSDLKLTADGKYLLVSTLKNGNVFIIDTAKTKVLKEIKAGPKSFNIKVSNSENIAYIANRSESSITVLDLDTMQLKDPIIVAGNPCYLELSEDGKKLYYLDAITGMVYYIQKNDNYFEPNTSKPLFKSNNIAKIQFADNKIYTLDRGENKLNIYYLNGKPKKNNIINVSDITSVSSVGITTLENMNNADDANKNLVYEDKKKSEKLTVKQYIRKGFRNLLYFKEDDVLAADKQENPNNQVKVYAVKPMVDSDTEEIVLPEKKSLKKYFKEFMHYKEDVEPPTELETIKTNVKQQMDFITASSRANDFVVIKDKIYLLCSDDYTVYVYDAQTNTEISSFELPQKGYYNSIKSSNDKTIGMITNISDKTLLIFDTNKDEVIQKLPLTVEVHNVVVTGKK